MKRQMIKIVAVLTVASILFVGCGRKEDIADTSTETETSVVESETSTQEKTTCQETTEVVIETEVSTERHEHSYTGEKTKEPTCDESGVTTYICSCGDTYTEETGKLDHCTDRSEITKQATCEEEGIKVFYCIFCGREIYTEKIAKLPHTESCNHGSADLDTAMDPKDYTFTQYIKLMYVVNGDGWYSWPDQKWVPDRDLEIGTAVPVVSKCDQADFYRTPWGMTISGKNLSEVRPIEYAPSGEGVWENFVEETDSKYTYWTGVYRVNGYEVHTNHMNKPYVERHIEYAKQGLYTLMYRVVDSKYWSGCYEIMIEKDSYFNSSEYRDWLKMYLESQGLKVSVESEEPLLVYRSPKEENSEQLIAVSVSVEK